MKNIKEKKVMCTKEIVESIVCDSCGKTVNAVNGEAPKGWHTFDSSHHGWGSEDSHKFHDVCSFNCYRERLIYAIKGLEDYEDAGAEIGGMTFNFAKKVVGAKL